MGGEDALREIAAEMLNLGRYHAMAAAETAAGGEAGMVAAVEPDRDPEEGNKNAAPADPVAMIRNYVAKKMTYGFSEGDIDRVTQMVLEFQARR